MDRDDQDVIRDVVRRFLVEVITDPGQMTEKMLHRDLVVDEWQIGTEQGPRSPVKPEAALLDQLRDGQSRQTFDAAGDSESGVRGVGSVGETVGGGEPLA